MRPATSVGCGRCCVLITRPSFVRPGAMYVAENMPLRNMYEVDAITRCSNKYQSNHPAVVTNPMTTLQSTIHPKLTHQNGRKIGGIFLVVVVVCCVHDVQFALLEMEDVGDDLDALKREIGYSKPVRSR